MSSNNDAAIALLEKHFDIAFAAPDGIKKLRELILSLAMQGKLVPQDPNDQPASELLKEIEAEKKRLVKEGKIKTSKPLPEIKPDEIPYNLPDSWKWVRLATIGEINPRNTCENDMDAGFVPMPLIFAGYRSLHKFEIRKWSEIKKGYTHFADGDVALAKITPCFENGKSCVFDGLPNGIGAGTTELHVFRNTFNCIYSNYLFAYLKNSKYLALGASKMTGSAGQKRVPTDFFSLNPFPLPPLAEQRRIVTKIDELMARCEQLEKLRGDRDRKQITVQTAALNRLLIAKQQSEFNTAWQFITQHFSELYSVKENVAELRKAILQLAVMGKLVPQDPKDQPASEFLQEIEKEKERLVKEGKIKKSQPLPNIKPDEVPYNLPKGWQWARLGEITQIKGGKRVSSGYKLLTTPTPYIYIRVSDMKNGSIDDSNLHFIDEEMHNKIKQYIICEEDIYMTIVGATIGKCGIVTSKFHGMNLTENAARIIIYKYIDKLYLLRCLESSFCQKQFVNKTKQVGVQKMALNRLLSTLIPLPPALEQFRIVAKTDQLMALCDNLEKQIDNVNRRQTNLLNAVMTKI